MPKSRWIVGLVVSLSLACVPSYLRAFSINGPSEAPNINVGDTILVNRAAYAFRLPYTSLVLFKTGTPERGDIIGIPGGPVEIRENRVSVNGRNYSPVALRPGQYFLLGDNREDSADSRLWGPVSRDLILGAVVYVLKKAE
jgi:signal peptidase I